MNICDGTQLTLYCLLQLYFQTGSLSCNFWYWFHTPPYLSLFSIWGSNSTVNKWINKGKLSIRYTKENTFGERNKKILETEQQQTRKKQSIQSFLCRRNVQETYTWSISSDNKKMQNSMSKQLWVKNKLWNVC